MTKKNASVTVIIPVYNRATLWRRAVDSVMQQDLLPSQIIIVNDGSTDATAENIRKWLGGADNATIKGVEISLLEQEHSNASTARNRGLSFMRSSAKGLDDASDDISDYVMFLDSDDELAPNFIQDATAVLGIKSDVVAVSSPRLSLVERDGIAEGVFDDLQDMAKSPVRWMLYNGAAILSCSLFRTSALPDKGFDGSVVIGEDMLFASQVAMQGEWAVVGGEPTKFWRAKLGENIKEEPSLSITNDPKQNTDSAIASIQARVRAFKLVRANKRVRVKRSYLHGILRDFYMLAFRSASGLAKYGYVLATVYHSAMRWITWLIRI